MDTQIPTHDQASELLGVYAMGIAEPVEQRLVEQHVARCVTCHAELQSLLAARDEIAFGAEQEPMPARLRTNILERVADVEAAQIAEAADASRRRRRPLSLGRMRVTRSLRTALPMAACLLLALGLAGVQTARLVDRGDQLDQLRTMSSEAVDQGSFLATSDVIGMDTSGVLAGAQVELADVHGTGLLVTKDLPKPPSGREWRVWGVTASRAMHPMGALAPRIERGMGLQPLAGMHDPSLAAIAITLEPAASTGPQRGPIVGWAQMA